MSTETEQAQTASGLVKRTVQQACPTFGNRALLAAAMPPNLEMFTSRESAVSTAIETLATRPLSAEHGAVYTKTFVAEALLDLCEYTEDAELYRKRLLEPSFGRGDFLVPAVRRLMASFFRSGIPLKRAASVLAPAIRGVELHRSTYQKTSSEILALLKDLGLSTKAANTLVSHWLLNDDFLLADLDGCFNVIVGNPPYVRRERIPAPLVSAYKRQYSTFYDRADLYVLFYERGLELLGKNGALGYICANRWVKNKYGGPLRAVVDAGFRLKYFVDMKGMDAFHGNVIAYPAITVIERTSTSGTAVGTVTSHQESSLGRLTQGLVAGVTSGKIQKINNVTNGSDPWLIGSPGIIPLLRKLEQHFPTLEASGGKVGIGVATGADKVYIGEYKSLPVERSRKLKLIMAKDCVGGDIEWGGKGVVNPYNTNGDLADFSEFPAFAEYMNDHSTVLKGRHTAKKQPDRWYRTIDRIHPGFTKQPKLLIPDIKGVSTVAFDSGSFYPHHNLYVITSDVWDLRALQAVMRSSIAVFFVAAYGVRMAGGFLRFQAQYLRRIRCPKWQDISDNDRARLVDVSKDPSQDVVDSVVLPLYRLNCKQQQTVQDYALSAQVTKKNR